MKAIGIIGGSGLTRLETLVIERQQMINTPYGEPSSLLSIGMLGDLSVVFLPRHGANHQIPPHKVNYRANMAALQQAGVEQVIGIAAVGGITPAMAPQALCVPDQIIDYTWGRKHTYFESDLSSVTHVDFTEPYCEGLRQWLLGAGKLANIDVLNTATYAATQGPRLETSAEITRLERDGCDVVGMTGMPEAALARELGLCYASLALVVNWAAGKGDGPITMQEIERHLTDGMDRIRRLLGVLSSR